MNKREFIKTGLIGSLGLMSIPTFGKTRIGFLFREQKEFMLPELPYAYDALEPYIDKETMELHHLKHHAAYTAKFNDALKVSGIVATSAMDLLKQASKYNEDIVNNGGGYVNHKMFWKCLAPDGGGTPKGDIAMLIDRDFGSFENFRSEFGNTAKTLFGSGWTWLILQNGALKIVTTANQFNPIMDILPQEKKGFPLLCLDVWEHAYYLKYQNRRAEYIDAFWNIVNWSTANKKLEKSTGN